MANQFYTPFGIYLPNITYIQGWLIWVVCLRGGHSIHVDALITLIKKMGQIYFGEGEHAIFEKSAWKKD